MAKTVTASKPPGVDSREARLEAALRDAQQTAQTCAGIIDEEINAKLRGDRPRWRRAAVAVRDEIDDRPEREWAEALEPGDPVAAAARAQGPEMAEALRAALPYLRTAAASEQRSPELDGFSPAASLWRRAVAVLAIIEEAKPDRKKRQR